MPYGVSYSEFSRTERGLVRTSDGLDAFERTRILKFHKNVSTPFGEARLAVFFKSDELYKVEYEFHRPKKRTVSEIRKTLESCFGKKARAKQQALPVAKPFTKRSMQDFLYESDKEEVDLRSRVDRFTSGRVVRSLFLTRRRIESGRTNKVVQLQNDRAIRSGGSTAKLAFLGTLAFDPSRRNLKNLKENNPFGSSLRVLKDVDFLAARLATPFTSLDSSCTRSWSHYLPHEAEGVFEGSGIDLLSPFSPELAQCGKGPLMDSLRSLHRANIRTLGAGENLAAARSPQVITIQGIRVGFLGYLFVDKTLTLPIDSFATNTQPGFAGIDAPLFQLEDMIREDVRTLAPQVDVTIVFLERGTPSKACPTQDERRLVDAALMEGASLVIGQGGKKPRMVRESVNGVALFSPGVWIDDRNSDASGLAFVVEINRRGIISYDFLPLAIGANGPRPLQGRAAKTVMETFSSQWKNCR